MLTNRKNLCLLTRKRTGVRVWLVTSYLVLLIFISGCMEQSATSTDIAIDEPALSPDGRLVAFRVWTKVNPTIQLAVVDLDTRAVTLFEGAADQRWLSPSFSPSGDSIVFVRHCRVSCTSAPKGYQISILHIESGQVATIAGTRNLVRDAPVFAPGGRFVFYATRRITDSTLSQHRLPKTVYYPRVGFKTGTIHMMNLQTEEETAVSRIGPSETFFTYTRAVGFLDERTLVVRGSGNVHTADQELWRQLQERVENIQYSHGIDEKGDSHLFTIEFRESLVNGSAMPRPTDIKLLATQWVRPIANPFHGGGTIVSYETKEFAFADRSERNRRPFLGRGPREYDIFLGDLRSVRQVTRLFLTRLHTPSISWSGNRIAFMGDEENGGGSWGLWVYDVRSGRTTFMDVKRLVRNNIPKHGIGG